MIGFFSSAVRINREAVSSAGNLTQLRRNLQLKLITTVNRTARSYVDLAVNSQDQLINDPTSRTRSTQNVLRRIPNAFIRFRLGRRVTERRFTLTLTLLTIPRLRRFFNKGRGLTRLFFRTDGLSALSRQTRSVLLMTQMYVRGMPALDRNTPLACGRKGRPARRKVRPPRRRHRCRRCHSRSRHNLDYFLAAQPCSLTGLSTHFLDGAGRNLPLNHLRDRRDDSRHRGRGARGTVRS